MAAVAASPAEPQSDRIDPIVWKITAVAMFGPLLSQLDATIVNVSLSSLATDLRTNLSTIHWVATGYLLALALMLPLNAWLVDRIGAKQLYLWCFGVFTVTSALCGLAWSANSLIGFRVLQGMSGGLMAPMAQMMMARAAGRHMAKVMGYSALIVVIGPILGPIIAGSILKYATWRWLFFVNVPVGALAILLAAIFLPPDRPEGRGRSLDIRGLALLSPGLVLFLYGTDHVAERIGQVCIPVALGLFAVFINHARRKGRSALMHIDLFKGPVFPISTATQFLSNGVNFASQFLVPIFLIRGCGRSPSEAGWMLAPTGIGMAVIAPTLGTLTDRFGIRKVSAGGALIALFATLPFLWFALAGVNTVLLAITLFFRGLGQGIVGIPSMTAAYSSVPKSELPMATTTLNIVQRVGAPTLTTAMATFLTWRLSIGHPGHYQAAFAAAFGLLIVFHGALAAVASRLPLRVAAPGQ